MNGDVVIRADGLGKAYMISHDGAGRERYVALRDVLAGAARRTIGRIRHPARGPSVPGGDSIEEFWALKDVSFEVRRGEVLGIVGRNGAGKSTLLKVLSRITEPTRGRVEIKGRLASLLEVGTGFHPELTGRENIFLNGAILGMTRAEIRGKFDEIVAFAEVEKFLDTPVKRYSSGMYVRLAFAIAAHLEPEILVVDEVLSVGDAEFQKKCLGKMQDVAGHGRTVLFVSHNMHAVEKLCRKAMRLHRGRLTSFSDDVRGVVSDYLNADFGGNAGSWRNDGESCRNAYFVPLSLEIRSCSVEAGAVGPFENWHPIEIRLTGEIKQADRALCIGVALFTKKGEPLFWSFMNDADETGSSRLDVGAVTLVSELPPHFLNEGDYRVVVIADLRDKLWLHDPDPASMAQCAFSIRGGLSKSPAWNRKRPGLLAPVLPWTIRQDAH